MQVLQGAVCPEVKMGLDDAVSAIASVTEVALTNDMSVAKIYISVYSDKAGRDIAMKGLSRLEGYVANPQGLSILKGTTPARQTCQHGPADCLHISVQVYIDMTSKWSGDGRGPGHQLFRKPLAASRYVRKHIAGTINMRMTPEIRFIHDDSIQRGEEVRIL